MTVIDAHVHMGPGLANHAAPPLLAAETAEQTIEIFDSSGIDMGCTFAPLIEGGDFDDYEYEKSNRFIYEASRRYPDRIIGYARVNPNLGVQALDEMKRCHDEYGFRGLKLHPDWEYFYMHGPTVRPVLDRAAEYGWPVIFHSGYYPLSQPTLAFPLADSYPTVNFILAHLSYRHTADAIVVAERCSNVYLEPSGNATATAIAEVLARLGPGKLLYGSDLPYTEPRDVMDKIRLQPGITPAALEQIFGGNLARLLGLDGASAQQLAKKERTATR
jgi:predicted TIM-barrel fold metal-dependent hydrolase